MALEFVSRVRELMAEARQRQQTRQFLPSLATIQEETPTAEPATIETDTAEERTAEQTRTGGRRADEETGDDAEAARTARRVDIARWLESVARGSSWPQQPTSPQTDPARSARAAAGESASAGSESGAWSESDTVQSTASDDSLGGDRGGRTSALRSTPPAAADSSCEEMDISDHSLSTLRGDGHHDYRSTGGEAEAAEPGPALLDSSLESVDSAYRYWGSVSDTSSSYSRINFVSGRSQPADAASDASVRPRRLTTFRECGEAGQRGVTVSLLDQWCRRRVELAHSTPPGSLASSVSGSAAALSLELQPLEGTVSRRETATSTLSPPVPPRVPAAAPESAETPPPPLPPRTCGLGARPALNPPRPERPASQPPLPPKRTPPPLPGKVGGGPAARVPQRHRQDSAGESETNSGGSSQEEWDGGPSSPVSGLWSSSASSGASPAQTGGAACRHTALPLTGDSSVLPSRGCFCSRRWERSAVEEGRAVDRVDFHRDQRTWQRWNNEGPATPRANRDRRHSSGGQKIKRLVEKFDGGDGLTYGNLSGSRL